MSLGTGFFLGLAQRLGTLHYCYLQDGGGEEEESHEGEEENSNNSVSKGAKK